MTPIPRRVDKRTALGGQCLLVGALSALPPENVAFTALLTAVGAYLAFGPRRRPAIATSSKLLLRAK